MAITITNSSGTVSIDYGSTPKKIETANKQTAFCTLFGNYVTIHRPEYPNAEIKLLWSDVSGATSATDLLNTINGYISANGSQVQVFVATTNQDTFTPLAAPNATTQAESGGNVYSVGSGITIVGATVVFDTPFSGGESVLIRNF